MAWKTDYLIVGAGASGLAFADTLLAHTDAHITIVDRDFGPGGHWNHAYPFVRLHQPSAFYGVASRRLGSLDIDTAGGNQGLCSLATGGEVLGYFQHVMERTLLSSGRVDYLPKTEYQPDRSLRSLVTGLQQDITVRKRIVHSCPASGTIPALHKRKYTVSDDAICLTPTELAASPAPGGSFVVLGSGKTGADTVLWLLERGVAPDDITWVMPRDAWWLDREFFQPTEDFYDFRLNYALSEHDAIIQASSVDDLFDRLETGGCLLRFDPDVTPTAYKCGTVTTRELEALRQIGAVVRKGHVRAVRNGEMELAEGCVTTRPGAIHVDCTASAVPKTALRPIFDGAEIHVQCVRACQPTFSAAVVAYLEASARDDAQRNVLARPIAYPTRVADWISQKYITTQNQYAWLQEADMRTWLKSCRLDGLTASHVPVQLSPDQEARKGQFKESMLPMMMALTGLVRSLAA